jgi:glycosyltransferase involved in cell wall biosynthesis
MNVAIVNWRDLEHPKAGGAEVVTDELASGLAERGHSITWFTSRHRGAASRSKRNGYVVERHGTELSCRLHGFVWLRRHRNDVDVVIDEVNTLPFFSRFATRTPVVLWMHQLAREIWLAEAPPIIGPIGYAVEAALLSLYRNLPLITGAPSSAASFAGLGLGNPVHVIHYPLQQPEEGNRGESIPGRIGYVGRITPSKRVDHLVRALARVRSVVPHAELIVVGRGTRNEERSLRSLADRLGIADAVTFTGHVSSAERDAYMRSFDVLALASLREGWGLVVSEAARFYVPSVVYPVPGLVDSVQHERSGIITARQDPEALCDGLLRVIQNRALREALGVGAADMLRGFTRERFVGAFEQFLNTQRRPGV